MNPLMAGMGQNPMMMGMPPAPFQFDKDADPAQLETQKQYFMQQMTIHQQLMQHFQAAYMQVCMQQQMMQTQGGSSTSTSSKGSGNQFAGKSNDMMSNPNAMMGMMPGSLPNMQG